LETHGSSCFDFARQSDEFSDHTNSRATAPYRETAADQAIRSEERLQTASPTLLALAITILPAASKGLQGGHDGSWQVNGQVADLL